MDRFITLAIHTYPKALPIKNLLESEGVEVELHNVNLDDPKVAPGVRIRIKESDLPLALRLVENREIFDGSISADSKLRREVLLPVDFADHSLNAARMAFAVARRMEADVVLLHSIIPTETANTFQLSDTYKYEIPADMEATRRELSDARGMMDRFCERLKKLIKDGDMPAARFRGTVLEGVPEEVILQYSRDKAPTMIVMGTRAADKKQSELIGSVTAEVLDSCRVPVFTIPEDSDTALLSQPRKVAFFCNGDQQDILAIDSLNRLFPDSSLEVTLIRIPSRRERKDIGGGASAITDRVLAPLIGYCREHYPSITFTATSEPLDRCADADVDLICVPNKKRNLFARVFNPSLAHKILFRADVPMIVIPV